MLMQERRDVGIDAILPDIAGRFRWHERNRGLPGEIRMPCIGTGLEEATQEGYAVQARSQDGMHDGRTALVIGGIRMGTVLEQQPHAQRVAAISGAHQQRLSHGSAVRCSDRGVLLEAAPGACSAALLQMTPSAYRRESSV
jgi:hypothetical protein